MGQLNWFHQQVNGIKNKWRLTLFSDSACLHPGEINSHVAHTKPVWWSLHMDTHDILVPWLGSGDLPWEINPLSSCSLLYDKDPPTTSGPQTNQPKEHLTKFKSGKWTLFTLLSNLSLYPSTFLLSILAPPFNLSLLLISIPFIFW